MTKLLQPATLDKKFEYKVKKDGDTYLVKARRCRLSLGRVVMGDLLLYKLGRIRKKLELHVRDVLIASSVSGIPRYDSFLNGFVRRMEEEILQKYKVRMDPEDLKLFFGQVHRHYMDYFSRR